MTVASMTNLIIQDRLILSTPTLSSEERKGIEQDHRIHVWLLGRLLEWGTAH